MCEFLLEDGHTVVGIDNLNSTYDISLKQWRIARLQSRSNFSFSCLDVTDRCSLQNLLQRFSDAPVGIPRAVVNLAAMAGVPQSLERPKAYYETNLLGTLNLLDLCREWSIKKFVLASTSSVYGEGKGPFHEDQATDHPLSPYAASKKAAETLCYTYHRLYEMDTTILRYFTVYGPAGRPDMSIFRFMKWIATGEPVTLYGDGSQERDFTYLDDIARGTVLSLKPKGHQIINLGSNRPIALNQVILLLEDLMGRKACVKRYPPQPSDVPATWANISKAQHLLGWKPEFQIERGLERTADWYRTNRSWVDKVRM